MSYSERIIKTTDSSGNRVRNIIGPEQTITKSSINKETIKAGDDPDMIIVTQTATKGN